VAALVLPPAVDAVLARQFHDGRQEQRLARHGVHLLDQLREEVKRVHGRADADNNTAVPAQQGHDDFAPDPDGHEGPFLAAHEIRIDASKAVFVFSGRNKKKTKKKESQRFFFQLFPVLFWSLSWWFVCNYGLFF